MIVTQIHLGELTSSGSAGRSHRSGGGGGGPFILWMCKCREVGGMVISQLAWIAGFFWIERIMIGIRIGMVVCIRSGSKWYKT